MEIIIKGTPEEIKEYLQNTDEETPIKQNLVIGGEEISTTGNNYGSCYLKATNLDELKNLNDQLIELYQRFIDFQVETEIAEDEE